MNNNILSNFIWRLLERFGAQGVTFVVSIVLARMLDPSVYGVIAIVNVLITFTSIFIDSGLSTALIQKENVDDLDYSTVFVFNVITSIILYLIVFSLSPFLARFYCMPELTNVFRTLGIVLLVAGVKSIQVSYVSRSMQFKKFFFATIGGTIGAGLLGILFAYKGFGVWALVLQHLFNTLVDTVILWITVDWRPKWKFSMVRLRVLFAYGWKILLNAFLSNLYYESRQLVIGKVYTTDQLAFFNKGGSFPNTILNIINSSLGSVIFPAMSFEQNNLAKVKNIAKKTIVVSSFFLVPALVGLAGCSEKLISLVLTEKWLPAVPFLQTYCITYIFYPFKTANISAFNAIGRSDITLIRSIINDILYIVILFVTIRINLYAVALSMILTMIISVIVDTYNGKTFYNYGFFEQIADVVPTYVSAIAMGVIVYFVGKIKVPNIVGLLLQVSAGVITYTFMSFMLHNPVAMEILRSLKKRTIKINGHEYEK